MNRSMEISTGLTEENMEDLEYQFQDYHRRGVVILFNHENFNANLALKHRSGTGNDAVRLEKAFAARGFHVHSPYNDKSHAEIKSILKTVSESHREEYGSVVIFALSHGLDGGQIAARDKFYSASDLREPFLDNPAFKDKPLVFVHQACRGKRKETFTGAISPSSYVNGDLLRSGQNDILLAFATLEGHESYRHQTEGSFYIQRMCDILEKNNDIEILDLLTAVNCAVLDICSKANDENGLSFDKIQTATYKSSLLKRFVLNRGYNTEAAKVQSSTSDEVETPVEFYVPQPECEYRGPAIIFHDENHTSEAIEFLESMKQFNFSCQTVDHEPTDRELINLSGNMNLKECSCLFIGIFFDESRLNFIHSKLLKYLSNSSCSNMSSKSKIFLFGCKEKSILKQIKTDDIESNRQVSCHSDVLAIYGYSTSFLNYFAAHLRATKGSDVISSARVAQRNTAQEINRPCNVIMSSTLRFRVDLSKQMLLHDDSTLKVSSIFQYNVRDPVKNFHFRTEELNEMHNVLHGIGAGKSISVWLTGFAGMGKTQTALQCVRNARSHNEYQNILWINGSSLDNILLDIQSIAEILEIHLPSGVNAKNRLSRFYKKITDFGNTLIVIDNLEILTKEEIIDLLPKEYRKDLLHIIVTSVHHVDKFKLPSKVEKCINIGPFTREECNEFITNNLTTIQGIPESLIETLGKELSYFPLDLGMIIALANKEMNSNISPSDVIENILKNMHNIPEDVSIKTKGYNKSSYQIVTHIMNTLVKNNDDLALQYLKMMAFCEPENIPNQILFQCKRIGVETKAVKTLISLQIISTNKNLYSIHRIVQNIVFNSLCNSEEQKSILQCLMQNVVKFQKGNTNYSETRKYILHASKISDNISSFSDLYTENKDCIVTISKNLHFVGWYENAKKFNTNHAKFISQMFGCNSKEYIDLVLNNVTILTLLEEFEKALNCVADLEKIVYHNEQYDKNTNDPVYEAQYSRNIGNGNEIKADVEENKDTLQQFELELRIKNEKSGILVSMAKFKEAYNVLQDVLQKIETLQDFNPSLVCKIKHSMTHVLIKRDKFEEALALVEEILPQMNEVGGGTDGDLTTSVMINKAQILLRLERNEEALKIIESVEDLRKHKFDETHPSTLHTKYYKGLILSGLERYEEAIEVFDFVLKHRKEYFEQDHFEIQNTLHYRAKALKNMGRHDEALIAFKDLLEAEEKKYGLKSVQAAISVNSVGSCYFGKGEYLEAYQHHCQALQLLDGLLPSTHPGIKILEENRDKALQALNSSSSL